MTQVWALHLSDSEKIVLLALADCANDEGHCWPSMRTLSAKCSKTDRTVQAAIKSLVDAGHLTRREVPGKGCNYTVHPRKHLTPEETSPPKGTTQTPEAASDKPSRTTNSEAKASSERVIAAWNEMAERCKLSPVRVLDNSRKQSLRLRLKEHGEATLMEAIEIVGRSPWLRGEGRDGNWRPGFDFVLQPSSLRKVLEGSYGGLEEALKSAVAMSSGWSDAEKAEYREICELRETAPFDEWFRRKEQFFAKMKREAAPRASATGPPGRSLGQVMRAGIGAGHGG